MPSLHPDAIGVESIFQFTSSLARAAEHVGLDTEIPTCPGWDMADLVWHLSEVQDFWVHIIENRPDGTPATYDRPTRPSDSQLVARLRRGVVRLTDALDRASPSDSAWSWAPEQTVAFTVRRQTHEALTHCVDGLLAAGLSLPPVSPELAADGIDEIVHVMINQPDDSPTGKVILRTTDTDDSWTVRLGSDDALISGPALELNLWLWGRGDTGPISISGGIDQANALRDLLISGTQ